MSEQRRLEPAAMLVVGLCAGGASLAGAWLAAPLGVEKAISQTIAAGIGGVVGAFLATKFFPAKGDHDD